MARRSGGLFGLVVGSLSVVAISLLASDAPLAQPVLLSHSVAAIDQAKMLRSFRPPPENWTQPDFEDSQWQRFTSSGSPSLARDASGSVVVVPSLWSKTEVAAEVAGLSPSALSAASAPSLLSEEPLLPGSEPETPQRELATDGGPVNSPPVAVIEVVGAAIRAGLASAFPAAPLVSSPEAKARRRGWPGRAPP